MHRPHRREDPLRRALDRAELFVHAAPAFLVALDRHQRVRLISPYGCAVLGYDEGELVGRNWYDVAVAESDRERTRQAFAAVMAGTREFTDALESRLVTRFGEERVVSWRRTLLRDARGRVIGTLSAGEDVTERRRAELALTHLAFHDALTDLPNRAYVEERLGVAVSCALEEGHAVAVLYVDLDRLGLVNDSLGHAAGDEVLRQAASRLRHTASAGEVVARHAGDEFLVVIEELPAAAAEDLAMDAARRFSSALKPPVRVGGAEFELGTSIGLSLLPGDAKSAVELLGHADAAMYSAKRDATGPRRYARPELSAGERLSLGMRLTGALEADQLVTHLQPIIELRSGRCQGYEALVRWHDPERGVIAPAAFIPYAEDTGLIEDIGRRVLEQVCDQLMGMDEGAWVSINVSPRELAAPGFATALTATLRRYEIDPAALVVELTETAIVTDAERVGTALSLLRAGGVRLAVDDFGSGYSSLARLSELPFDLLKIDARFLRRVPADPDAARMLRAVIEFTRALGLTTVAEGVETDGQRDALVDLGCPLAQGWLLGRPAPAEHWVGRTTV